MFLNLGVLKKLIKNAYNTCGLWVGHREAGENNYESYYISGAWWIVSFNALKTPKEVKAAIIELAGELPEVGKLFMARKKEMIQYEIEQFGFFIQEDAAKASIECTVSNLIVDSKYSMDRLLTAQYKNELRTISINDVITSLIDITLIDSDDDETLPLGPYMETIQSTRVLWQNDRCTLAVYTKDPSEDEETVYRNKLGVIFENYRKK